MAADPVVNSIEPARFMRLHQGFPLMTTAARTQVVGSAWPERDRRRMRDGLGNINRKCQPSVPAVASSTLLQLEEWR
jgi:hypothetical protein